MNKILLAACTPAQEKILKDYTHFIPVEMLSDGDILVLDRDCDPETLRLGPYVLMQNGFIQDVTYHYRANHGGNPHDK
jgi:hypothetical protein